MTEAEWNRCEDPQKMLAFLQTTGRATDRKVWLFACACTRLILQLQDSEPDRRCVETAEKLADGLATEEDLWEADQGLLWDIRWYRTWWPWNSAGRAVDCWRDEVYSNPQRSAAELLPLLGDIFGPIPFRFVTIDPSLLLWNEGLAVRLAQVADDDRLLPAGHLDPDRLAVLADALEEAGCADAELLAHLRSPGPHVRGCFALDAVLGKS